MIYGCLCCKLLLTFNFILYYEWLIPKLLADAILLVLVLSGQMHGQALLFIYATIFCSKLGFVVLIRQSHKLSS